MVELVEKQANIIADLQKKVCLLEDQLAYLKRMMFGKKKETIIDNGIYLTNFELPEQDEDLAEPKSNEKITVEKHEKAPRKPFKRFEFPKDAPREEIIIDLSEEEKEGLKYIGNDEVEKLAYRPGSFYIKVCITKKYASIEHPEKGITVGEVLPSAIPGSRVDESMLSHLLISKYCDHLPLYRLEGIYSRDGLSIKRQTLSSWALQAGALLNPLADLLLEEIMNGGVIFTDDTTIPLLAKVKTKTARMWVYVGGGGADPPLVFYQFTNDRKICYPIEKFRNYQGAFHSDAFSAYEKISAFEGVTWQLCWAHARRKFFDSLSSHPLKDIILKKIDELFIIEREAWDVDNKEISNKEKKWKRIEIRKNKSAKVVDEIFNELKASFKTGVHMPKESLTKAIAYLLTREKHFRSFLDNPELRIDNNVSERNIKPLVIGRKNWLFAGSEDGGKTTATILSLVQTCKNLKINPQKYLENVLRRINGTPKEEFITLLPQNWKKL